MAWETFLKPQDGEKKDDPMESIMKSLSMNKQAAPAMEEGLISTLKSMGAAPQAANRAANASQGPSESAARIIQQTSQPISKRANRANPNFPTKKSLDLDQHAGLGFFSDTVTSGPTAKSVHQDQLQHRLAFQQAYNTEEKAINTLRELMKPRLSHDSYKGKTPEEEKARSMGYRDHTATLAAATKGLPANDWRQTFVAQAAGALARNASLGLGARQSMLDAIKALPAAPAVPAAAAKR